MIIKMTRFPYWRSIQSNAVARDIENDTSSQLAFYTVGGDIWNDIPSQFLLFQVAWDIWNVIPLWLWIASAIHLGARNFFVFCFFCLISYSSDTHLFHSFLGQISYSSNTHFFFFTGLISYSFPPWFSHSSLVQHPSFFHSLSCHSLFFYIKPNLPFDKYP